MFSSTFHVHAIWQTPQSSKLARNAGGAYFLQLYCKKSTVTLIFYLMILIKTMHPFNEKKKVAKAMSSILAIPWPAKREVVSHTCTVRAWRTGRPRAFTKSCPIRHPKFLQVEICLFQDPRYWGKRSEKNAWKFESLVTIFYCIRYMNYHF